MRPLSIKDFPESLRKKLWQEKINRIEKGEHVDLRDIILEIFEQYFKQKV